MAILNQLNDKQYRSTYPRMKGIGKDLEATHEIHIFLAKLNPNQQALARYTQAVDDWNAKYYTNHGNDARYKITPMKACYLALIFRDALNGEAQEICVMQSSRYIYCDDPEFVIAECHKDAQWFAHQYGLDVIREKIEARAYGIDGIPITDEDTKRHSTKYFEFHVKIGRQTEGNVNAVKMMQEDEIVELKQISRKYSDLYKIPIPLSFNKHKGYQRYLNLRFRNMGRENAMSRVERVAAEIEKNTKYKIVKIIPEYVWYDSYTALDKGWIDYTQKELETLFKTKGVNF
eukprot:CAMPEP_0197030908 /NCGR_PEP_ID=MMETSP1384-20130603/10036_1 /TAXON_ID=29189 /ORGANISM="Ammonia sp." /LENGTH=288 /DNA_ID=CAMNT_0042460341 /DNA_START=20 /DNA_END=883 /DNA_ORIENTATION=+